MNFDLHKKSMKELKYNAVVKDLGARFAQKTNPFRKIGIMEDEV